MQNVLGDTDLKRVRKMIKRNLSILGLSKITLRTLVWQISLKYVKNLGIVTCYKIIFTCGNAVVLESSMRVFILKRVNVALKIAFSRWVLYDLLLLQYVFAPLLC